ncbi:hypothetical protein [Dyadobacter sp.]
MENTSTARKPKNSIPRTSELNLPKYSMVLKNKKTVSKRPSEKMMPFSN